VKKTDEQWKQQLSDEEYRITREAGTEPAFSGRYYNNKDLAAIFVNAAARSFSVPMKNTTRVRAGRVFTSQKVTVLLKRSKIQATA